MRTLRFALCSVLLLTCGSYLAAQTDVEKKRTPKKGDKIIVKGCLNGPSLVSTETGMVDATGLLATAWTYQLKGDKDLLKQLRDKHDGHLVEVTGILKSTLPQPENRHGKQLGKTRVFVGVGETSQQRPPNGTEQPLPVLEVESFEGYPTACAR